MVIPKHPDFKNKMNNWMNEKELLLVYANLVCPQSVDRYDLVWEHYSIFINKYYISGVKE